MSFLLYDLRTTKNVLYYDVDTHIIKLASRVWFDDGMSKLPMADNTLNFQYLHRVDNVQPLPEEQFFL